MSCLASECKLPLNIALLNALPWFALAAIELSTFQ
jgi:hypothetical protein